MRTPPEMTCGSLIQLVFCKKKKTVWFIGVEVEQERSAPPLKKNPGSAPELINPLNPNIKIEILIYCSYYFSTEVVGRIC